MPCWLVVATLTFPPGPLAVTLAPGTSAPEGSVTWPRMAPVPIWPQAAVVMTQNSKATHPNRDELIYFSPEIRIYLLLLIGSAHAEVPATERHALSTLGRACENGFHPREKRDRGNLIGLRSGGARDDQGVARFQIRQIQRRHLLNHLLEIHAAATAARPARRAARPAASHRGWTGRLGGGAGFSAL